MAVWYEIKLKPLGEYFLGGERNFDFENSNEKTDYYIESEKMPTQSTLLGMLRFLVLQKNGKLSDSIKDINPEETKNLIGLAGFSINNTNGYGKIKQISPLFIVGGDEGKYIITPLNCKHMSSYEPYTMDYSKTISCETGTTAIPEGYDAKDGLEYSFMCVNCGHIIKHDDIFTYQTHTRITKKKEEEAFFKKKYCYMKNEYSFGFYALLEDECIEESGIVYLGQEKSSFEFNAKKMDGLNEAKNPFKTEISDKIKELDSGIRNGDYTLALLLSDAICTIKNLDDTKLDDTFYITEKKFFRTLNSTGEKSDYISSRKKSCLYQLYRAGSIFYIKNSDKENFMKKFINSNLQSVGFNNFVFIEGREVKSDEK